MGNKERNDSVQVGRPPHKTNGPKEVSKTAKEFSGGILTNEIGDYDDDALKAEDIQDPL